MADPLDMKPLPSDPIACRGFSERHIRSHHQDNHGAALKDLPAKRPAETFGADTAARTLAG